MKTNLVIFFIFFYSLNVLLAQNSGFKSGEQYQYATVYTDSVKDIIIQDTISLFVMDTPWKNSPKKQKTMVWKYESMLDASIKSQIISIGEPEADSTGYVNNEAKLWMHPPRHHQYTITEIAAFPYLVFPLAKHKTYQRILFIGKGWGDWENLKLKYTYEITDSVSYVAQEIAYTRWTIKSESKSELGVSTMEFIYDEQLGFLSFDYDFYDDKKISIELINNIKK